MSKYETKYRVIENRRCNDFNDELPYTIITVDYDPKNDLIRTRGFANWGRNKNDLIDDRKEAERVFVNLMCKDLKKELIKECQEHQEAMQIADKRIKAYQNELELYKRAFDVATMDLDLCRNHSQTLNYELVERVENLRNTILERIKEKMEGK